MLETETEVTYDNNNNQQDLVHKISQFHPLDVNENSYHPEIKKAKEWRDDINTLQADGWFHQIEKYDPNFTGYVWRLCDNWMDILDVTEYSERPIRYLEIGTLCGANLISVAKTYASHPDSILECIDIWEDTDEYSEYKYLQTSNYNHFLANVYRNGLEGRTIAHKDYSYRVFPMLENNVYDIIYIDANHESWAVLEDGVHAFRKCKPDGWIIFDDYTFSEETQRGIDSFLNCFNGYISEYYIEHGQCYVRLSK